MTPALMSHPGELSLRKLHVGEPVAALVFEHAQSCGDCQARMKGFAVEQQQFEAEIPFERFAAGVQRAARTPTVLPKRSSRVVMIVGAIAAMAVVTVAARLAIPEEQRFNTVKSAGGIELAIAGSTGQRKSAADAPVPEKLAAGERVRVGLERGDWRYALVISIDDHGVVTPIYTDGVRSMALASHGGTQYLPDSLEFTGSGLERLIVVMSEAPVQVSEVTVSAQRAFAAAGGNLLVMKSLPFSGEFHRTFLKP